MSTNKNINMLSVYVIQLLFHFQYTTGFEFDYCAFNKDHILCNAGKPKDFGKDIYFFPSTDNERQELLHEINLVRDEIASGKYMRLNKTLPSASSMLQLQWSEECEAASWKIVRECTTIFKNMVEICCRCMNTETLTIKGLVLSGLIGEVKGSPPRLNLSHVMQTIQADKARRTFEEECFSIIGMMTNDKCSEFDSLNHMAVDLLSHVGCVFVSCKSNKLKNSFACYFGGLPTPATLYKQGDSCTKCHENAACSTKYPHLCECKPNKICVEKPPPMNLSCHSPEDVFFNVERNQILQPLDLGTQAPPKEEYVKNEVYFPQPLPAEELDVTQFNTIRFGGMKTIKKNDTKQDIAGESSDKDLLASGKSSLLQEKCNMLFLVTMGFITVLKYLHAHA